jgi:hypothetical protein
MITRIGTIQEITGKGYEILIDTETRSFVLARFFNGRLVTGEPSQAIWAGAACEGSSEPTLAPSMASAA